MNKYPSFFTAKFFMPLQFLAAIVSGYISYCLLKSYLQIIVPEMPVLYLTIFSICISLFIELTIIYSIHYGFAFFKIDKKKSVILFSVSIVLFVLNYMLINAGNPIIVKDKLDKSTSIKDNLDKEMVIELSKIDSSILFYEQIVMRNDTTKKNWLNSKTSNSNVELASFRIKQLTVDKESIKKDFENKKELLLKENSNEVLFQTKKYNYFSVSLILIIIFFSTVSGLLSSHSITSERTDDNKNGTSKEETRTDNDNGRTETRTDDLSDGTSKEETRTDDLSDGTSKEETRTEENILCTDELIVRTETEEKNELIINDLKNKISYLENRILNQRQDFINLVQMKNDIEASKRMVDSPKKELINKTILPAYKIIKDKLQVNGEMEEKYTNCS